jgi:myosin heavy subunit
MWSLNNFASKASEVVNAAKKGISDITKDPVANTNLDKKNESPVNVLKKQCLKYKDEIARLNQEIHSYKQIIMEINEDRQKNALSNKLINFKIVIGKDDSDQDLKVFHENQQKIQELDVELQRKKNELETLEKISSENTQSYKQEIETQSDINSELSKRIKILEDQLQTVQTGYLKYKTRLQNSIIDCYKSLKSSYNTLGLSIPQINPDNLGLEDVQEFIDTSTSYIDDTLKAFNSIFRPHNKNPQNLVDLKTDLVSVLNDFNIKTKEYIENSKGIETNYMKIQKEKEDMYKIITKKDERIKILMDEVKKTAEDGKIFEETKVNNEKLNFLLKNVSEMKENAEKSVEDLKIKLKKVTEHALQIEETNSNLNTRIKFMNSNIVDKENSIKSLLDQNISIKSSYLDIQADFEGYKLSTEKQIKDLNELYSTKIIELQETTNTQISDLKSQLIKAQNEAKDSNIAKIQSSKYQQAVEKLQEIIKNLENQSSHNTQKIDKLTLQNEKNAASLKKRKEKIKKLKECADLYQSQCESMKKEHELEKEILINKAKESEMIRNEAESLLSRIETQIQASDSMIDKRIITTFLLNYLNEKNNNKVKIQMLKALAEMLGLNQEQRTKIGLGQDQTGYLYQLASYITRSN